MRSTSLTLRKEVYPWVINAPELTAGNSKRQLQMFYEKAMWYNGQKKWTPLKNMVALEFGSRLLKDNFESSALVCGNMPEGQDAYKKLCEIIGVEVLMESDFKTVPGKVKTTDAETAAREISKRLMYLVFKSCKDTKKDWIEEYKKLNEQFSKVKIESFEQIYFSCEEYDLKEEIQFYAPNANQIWYTGSWNGGFNLSKIVDWLCSYYPFVKNFDTAYIERLFSKPFNYTLNKENAGSLPQAFLDMLSEADRKNLLAVEEEEPVADLKRSLDMKPEEEDYKEDGDGEEEDDLEDEESDVDEDDYTDEATDDGSNADNLDNSDASGKSSGDTPSSTQTTSGGKPKETSKPKTGHHSKQNESDEEEDPRSFEDRNREDRERRKNRTLSNPTSNQPTHKPEEETYNPEEKVPEKPSYGDVDGGESNLGNRRRGQEPIYDPSSVDSEVRKAAKQKQEAEDDRSRQQRLSKLPPYTLDWFITRHEMIRKNEKTGLSDKDFIIEFYDWCLIDPERHIYRLVSPSRYIPKELADYGSQMIYVSQKGKLYRIDDAEVIESDDSGIDLRCTNSLGAPSAERKIRIIAKKPGSFADDFDTRLLRLEDTYALHTNLNNELPDEKISFIYGPPGTGKTTELVKIITEELSSNPHMNILVVTPTNRAADVVAEKLCEICFAKQYVSRFGVTVSENLIRNHPEVLKNRKSCRVADSPKNVVITTIARYPYDVIDNEHIFDMKWDFIIVDEASMIDVTEITLLLLNNKADKFIISGDPRQVRPVTIGARPTNIYDMVGLQSFANAINGYKRFKVTALKTQHRSVPVIGKMVSKFYYDGMLESDSKTAKPLDLPGLNVDNINTFGYRVDNFSQLFGKNAVDGSAVHIYSAIFAYEFASFIAKSVEQKHPEQEYSIGIVTPYRKQADAIGQMLHSHPIDTTNCKVDSGTVHQFQGGDRDIMIVVMNYPSNSEADMAHINDKNILNVSMSRARDYLFFLMPERSEDDKSRYPMNTEVLKAYPYKYTFQHACDIEGEIFGDPMYIANNSAISCHFPVNVSAGTEKKYEVRLSDTALDIQINEK